MALQPAMRSCWALLALAALAAWRPGPGVRADGAFRCPACTPERISLCPTAPPTSECAELVRQPGCGCCPACALDEEAPCGVYTARCGSGLRCVPRGGTERPLHQLIEGLGHCVRVGEGGGPTAQADMAGAERGDLGDLDETHHSHEASASPAGVHSRHSGRQRLASQPLPPPGRFVPLANPKADAIGRSVQKFRETARIMGRTNVPKEEPGGKRQRVKPLWVNGDRSRVESTCESALELVVTRLGMMEFTDQGTSPEDLFIPNCDHNGLYISKQCKAAANGHRGMCWCVDPATGKHLAGTPTVRGDIDCQRFLTQTRAGREDPAGGVVGVKTKPPPTPSPAE